MSASTVEMPEGDAAGASRLIARAAMAAARARRRTAAEIRDLLSEGDARLDDRTRTAAAACLDAVVSAIDGLIRERAANWLVEHGDGDAAERLSQLSIDTTVCLADAGILSETALIEEILGRVGEALLAERMPIDLPGEADAPGIVLRLTGARDAKVAQAATALLAADAARRAELAGMTSTGDLPAPLRAHLAWPIVAVLRSRVEGGPAAATDAALAHAAGQVIGSIGEVHPLEATAMRLAKALAPDRDELPLLIADALADRRLSLAIALIARGFGADYSAIRDVVLDPDGERLWLVLRAIELDRRTIARIGYLLCEADSRRSTEGFADMLDLVMAVSVDQAADAVGDLRLPSHFRDALHLLQRRGVL